MARTTTASVSSCSAAAGSPSGRPRSCGRAARIRTSARPLGKVDRTIEIGAFVEQDISDSFRVRGEILKGLGGHEGLVGSLGADKVWRDGDKYLFAIGPRVRLADEKFHRAFFGITPAAALATGQPVYTPGGGIYAVGLTSSANYDLGGNWGLFGYAAYDRLVGDAKKSPVVRAYGSANQLSAGIGVNLHLQRSSSSRGSPARRRLRRPVP